MLKCHHRATSGFPDGQQNTQNNQENPLHSSRHLHVCKVSDGDWLCQYIIAAARDYKLHMTNTDIPAPFTVTREQPGYSEEGKVGPSFAISITNTFQTKDKQARLF